MLHAMVESANAPHAQHTSKMTAERIEERRKEKCHKMHICVFFSRDSFVHYDCADKSPCSQKSICRVICILMFATSRRVSLNMSQAATAKNVLDGIAAAVQNQILLFS